MWGLEEIFLTDTQVQTPVCSMGFVVYNDFFPFCLTSTSSLQLEIVRKQQESGVGREAGGKEDIYMLL